MTRMAILLRLESAAVAAGFGLAMWAGGADWRWVAAGLILPDLFIAGYRWGPVIGARAYNVPHSYLCPAALMAVAMLLAWPQPAQVIATPLGALSAAVALHIAIDRMLGYGLKLPTGFRDTHLGRIGHG